MSSRTRHSLRARVSSVAGAVLLVAGVIAVIIGGSGADLRAAATRRRGQPGQRHPHTHDDTNADTNRDIRHGAWPEREARQQ